MSKILDNVSLEISTKINLTESSSNLLKILSKPVSCYYYAKKHNNSLFSLWTENIIKFAKEREDFIYLGNTTMINGVRTEYSQKFEMDINNLLDTANCNLERIKNDCSTLKELTSEVSSCYSVLKKYDETKDLEIEKTLELLDESESKHMDNCVKTLKQCIKEENSVENINIQKNLFNLLVVISKYTSLFECNSININIWNYSLRSNSTKFLITGYIVCLIQILFTSSIIYHCIAELSSVVLTTDPLIYLVCVLAH